MKTISLCAAAAALILAAGPAAALPYAGAYENDPSSVTVLMYSESAGAPQQGGVMFKGVSKTTDSGGKADTSPYTCISWLTPGQGTASAGVCSGGNSAGDTWSLYQVCASDGAPDPSKASSCWGELRGTGGALKGKTGQMSQFGTTVAGATQGAWN